MGKLSVFNFITLNGFYKGANDDISWHRHGAEESEYAAVGLKSGGMLLFGRVTYEMMASYWPTSMAAENDPAVAEGMNTSEKIVFSKTLKKAEWKNTKIICDNVIEEVKKLKKGSKDMTILGSGGIVAFFAENGMIDEYRIMVDPVAIGEGKTIFSSIKNKLDLKLTGTKSFKSGVVILTYTTLP